MYAHLRIWRGCRSQNKVIKDWRVEEFISAAFSPRKSIQVRTLIPVSIKFKSLIRNDLRNRVVPRHCRTMRPVTWTDVLSRHMSVRTVSTLRVNVAKLMKHGNCITSSYHHAQHRSQNELQARLPIAVDPCREPKPLSASARQIAVCRPSVDALSEAKSHHRKITS